MSNWVFPRPPLPPPKAKAHMHSAAGWSHDGRIALIEERSHFDESLRLVDGASGIAKIVAQPYGKARFSALRWRKTWLL